MIPIQNVYYMLAYAFQILNEDGYKSVATEQFDNVAELCAAILIKGFSLQVKRGLVREYVAEKEQLSSLRGKIEITDSIKNQTLLRQQLVCTYDEFSVNSYTNRIIKTTMSVLMHSEIDKAYKKRIKQLMLYLNDVQKLDVHSINWAQNYNRNNQSYKMMISICYLVIKGLLQTTTDGKTKLMQFIDEQRMCRLYEKFILEFYRKEMPNIKANASKIEWQIDGTTSIMLPSLQSDIMLNYKEKTLIIDAKYYSRTTQVQFGKHSLHSANVFQIFTYVKNEDVGNTGNVAGMLLYAKTDEEIVPDEDVVISGNKISAKTLDLNCDFETIKSQLIKLASDYFELA